MEGQHGWEKRRAQCVGCCRRRRARSAQKACRLGESRGAGVGVYLCQRAPVSQRGMHSRRVGAGVPRQPQHRAVVFAPLPERSSYSTYTVYHQCPNPLRTRAWNLNHGCSHRGALSIARESTASRVRRCECMHGGRGGSSQPSPRHQQPPTASPARQEARRRRQPRARPAPEQAFRLAEPR